MKWWIGVTVSVDWYHVINGCEPVQAVTRETAYQVLRAKQSRYEDIAYVIGPFDRKPTRKIGIPKQYNPERRS